MIISATFRGRDIIVTIDRWIAVLSSVAAMISAIFAACGIYQAIMQRRSMYKPQIIPQNFYFKGRCTDKLHFQSDILQSNVYNEYKVSVLNPGLGAAVNIKYEWLFDYQEFAKRLQKRLSKLNPTYGSDDPAQILFMHHVEENEHSQTFHFRATYRHLPHVINKNPELIQCFLPYSVQKETTELRLQTLSLVLLMNDLLLNFKEGAPFKTVNGPLLKLSYQDIGGRYVVDYFDTKVTLLDAVYMRGIVDFQASMVFNKIKMTRTAVILQKLRKSYADFITEHDFNKNS